MPFGTRLAIDEFTAEALLKAPGQAEHEHVYIVAPVGVAARGEG